MLWQNSQLAVIGTTDMQEISERDLSTLYRTVVLYFWVQGYDVRDIRRILELPDREEFYIYTSELEGLGELCAYQLEAISKGLESRTGSSEQRELSGMFYSLSIRIKYGMSNDLSRIANKHIRGLNRTRLLKIEKAANAAHSNVTEYILKHQTAMKHMGMTNQQLLKLRQLLQSVLKYQRERLWEQVKRTALIDTSFCHDFLTLESLSSEALDALSRLFNNKFDQHFKITHENAPCVGEFRSCGLKVYLCLQHKEYHSSQEIFAECGEDAKNCRNTLFLYKNDSLEDAETAHSCMLIGSFCELMLRCIVLSGSNDLSTAGEHFLALLRERIQGRDIMADGKMKEKTKRSKLPCYVLYDQMNDTQQDKWNKLYRDVDRAKDLRNAVCHYGVQLQAADSIELREKAIAIIAVGGKLSSWMDELPIPQKRENEIQG